MNDDLHNKILVLEREKKSLHDSPKKRQLQGEIDKMKKFLQIQKQESYYPVLYVKKNNENIGTVQFDEKENSYLFCDPIGIKTEVGVSYKELRHWAVMNGYSLRADGV